MTFMEMKLSKHMKVYLTAAQWTELKMDEMELFVRSAFYLSLPYTYIAHRVRFHSFEKERATVIESAKELGLTDLDTVVVIKGS